MHIKDKSNKLKKGAELKNKRFIKRIQPWIFFDSMEIYENYYYHDFKRVLLISQTLAMPRFLLGFVFLLVKLSNKFFKLFRLISRLIRYLLYFPAKVIFPIIQIGGKIIYHLFNNRLSYQLCRFLGKLAAKMYHSSCEVIALIIIWIIGIPAVIWFVSRVQILLKNILHPLKNILWFFIRYLVFLLAGHPSIICLFPLYVKAKKIECSGNINCDIVKSFLGYYIQSNIPSNEIFVSETPLFNEGLIHNSITSRLETIDTSQRITQDDFIFFFHAQHEYTEIIEAYSHLCRYPNPLASSALKFLLYNLPQKIKLPKNRYVPEIYEEHKYFSKKKKAKVSSTDCLLIIPVSSYDEDRLKAKKLTARILEAYLALQCNNLHVKIILPLKSKHDNSLRKCIEKSLSQCEYPKTARVSWDILEPICDISIASVRGAQMLWAINNIVSDKNIHDNAIVIFSEMVGSVSYNNIPLLLQALHNNCIVTASRHAPGARVLNKTIPDQFNSLVYNLYSRLMIPGTWSDSSAPLKVISKKQLSTLLPYISFCSAGMIDFTFDEGFLAVAHSLSLKVFQCSIFWSDQKQTGGAERTIQGIKSQLYFTNILGKKIRMLRQLLCLKSTEKLFITAGMDFNVTVSKELKIIKSPVKLLNNLEILLSLLIKKPTIDHTRFGIAGKILIKILPNYFSKRLGVIAEGKLRNPADRLEILLPLIKECPVVENIKIFPTDNDFYIEQKMLPLLLGDALDLNVWYNDIDGIKAVLESLINFNKVLHVHSLFDGDFKSIKDISISMGETWHLKLLDFADLVYYRDENVSQVTDNLPDKLMYRIDFLTIKKILLSKPEWAKIFFIWYEQLKELYKYENVIARRKNERLLFNNNNTPLIKQNKNSAFINNFTLLTTDGIGQMSDQDSFNTQIALIPPMDIDFPVPQIDPLPNQLPIDVSIYSPITIVFLSNDETTIWGINCFMKEYFSGIKYRILKNNDSSEDVNQLMFKNFCSRLPPDGDIIIIPIDGQSARIRSIMPKDISHKAFLNIDSYPLVYWIILSTINFLVQKTTADALVLYIHGDTIVNFENQIPEPSLYAPELICRIARALPKNVVNNNANNENQARNLGKVLQSHKKEGWEFPGLFIIKRSMIPLLADVSLKQNFWTNVSRMTSKIKGLKYKTSLCFFDLDTPYNYWKLYLLTYMRKSSEKKIKHDKRINAIQNRVYISKDSEMEIVCEGNYELEIELNNIIVAENSIIKIHIPDGMSHLRISNAVFTKSKSIFCSMFPSVTGILAANFNDIIANLMPLTCYGVNSIHPLCPDITNNDGL
jgi:hypothetical protein